MSGLEWLLGVIAVVLGLLALALSSALDRMRAERNLLRDIVKGYERQGEAWAKGSEAATDQLCKLTWEVIEMRKGEP